MLKLININIMSIIKELCLTQAKRNYIQHYGYRKKLNKRIEVLPRVVLPKNIKTADYIIDGEFWDLKVISSNKNYAVYVRIRNQEKQSNNFIFDISQSKLTIKSVVKQLEDLYKLKNFKWLQKVIIKKNNSIEIIIRSKKS